MPGDRIRPKPFIMFVVVRCFETFPAGSCGANPFRCRYSVFGRAKLEKAVVRVSKRLGLMVVRYTTTTPSTSISGRPGNLFLYIRFMEK